MACVECCVMPGVIVTGGGVLRWRVTEMRLEAWVEQIMEGPVEHLGHNGSRKRE